MSKNDLEKRIKELELEINNLKSGIKVSKEPKCRKSQFLKESNDKFLNLANNISGYIAYVNADSLRYEFVNELYVKLVAEPV